MPTTDRSINIVDFVKFVCANKSLLLVLVVLGLIIVSVFLFIAYGYEQKAIKLHQDLLEHGVVVEAVSYRDNCNNKSADIRLYRFVVEGKTYTKSYRPDDGVFACASPLGDTVTVYYDKNNPNRNLSEYELNAGVPSRLEYAIIAILFSLLFLCYAFYKIVVLNYQLMVDEPNGQRV